MSTNSGQLVEAGKLPPDAGFTRAELQSRAVRGGLASSVQVLVTIPLGFVSAAIVARVLGPIEFGLLALLTLLLANAAPVLDFGFSAALNQFGFQAEATGRRAQTIRLLQSGIGWALLVPAPILSLGGAYFLRHEPWWVVATFVLVMYATPFLAAGSSALYVQNRSASIAFLGTVTGAVAAASAIAVVLLTQEPVHIWLTRVVITLALPGAALVLVSRQWGWRWVRPRLPRHLPEGFWRFGLLAGAGALTGTLVFTRSEIYVFRIYDLPTELGLYALAFGIAQQLLAPLEAVLAPLAPAQGAMVYAHPEHALRSLLRSTALVATISGGLVALTPFIAVAFPLVFGEDFRGAGPLFAVLAIAASSKTLMGPLVVSFNARRRGTVLAVAPALALVVDIGVALVAILVFGVWGAVLANVLAQSLVLLIYVRAELGYYERGALPLLRACVPWLLGIVAAGAGATTLMLTSTGQMRLALPLVVGGIVFWALIRLFARGAVAELPAIIPVLPGRLRPAAALALRALGTQ